MILNGVLRALGALMAVTARVNPRLRAQLGHRRVIEIRVDGGAGRQFVFGERRVRTQAAGHEPAVAALVFANSGVAIRSLLSPRLPARLMAAVHNSQLRIESDALPLLWFMGFAQQVLPIRRAPHLPWTPPDGYTAHTCSVSVSRRITRLGEADEIDPELTDELAARADLRMMHGARGQMLRF